MLQLIDDPDPHRLAEDAQTVANELDERIGEGSWNRHAASFYSAWSSDALADRSNVAIVGSGVVNLALFGCRWMPGVVGGSLGFTNLWASASVGAEKGLLAELSERGCDLRTGSTGAQ